MGNKRFTDKSKWRNEWFRTLPMKAKLAWTYLCDECDYCGVWKADYGLASFQLDFTLTKQNLQDWFGNKVHMFNGDLVLLTGFYEFQYSESKDTWTAKVKARERLESFGFSVKNNKIIIPQSSTVGDSTPSVLIEGDIDIVVDIDIKNNKEDKKFKVSDSDLELIYKSYPLKKGKHKGFEKAKREIVSAKELEELEFAVNAYKADVERNKTKPEYIKHFSTFMSEWRDWLDPETGSSIVSVSERADLGAIWNEGEGA